MLDYTVSSVLPQCTAIINYSSAFLLCAHHRHEYKGNQGCHRFNSYHSH